MLDLLDSDAEYNFPERAAALRQHLYDSGALSSHFVWGLEGVKYNEHTEGIPLIILRWSGWSICCGTETEYSIVPYFDFFTGRFDKVRHYAQPMNVNSSLRREDMDAFLKWF